MGETELPMEVTESSAYLSKYERLRSRVAKYCLPDQADKVILTVLVDMQGYDAQDTYRNISSTIAELASDNLGINS